MPNPSSKEREFSMTTSFPRSILPPPVLFFHSYLTKQIDTGAAAVARLEIKKRGDGYNKQTLFFFWAREKTR
jgi:hypothetical protein